MVDLNKIRKRFNNETDLTIDLLNLIECLIERQNQLENQLEDIQDTQTKIIDVLDTFDRRLDKIQGDK